MKRCGARVKTWREQLKMVGVRIRDMKAQALIETV
jgi:hypothetical protein